MTLTVQPPATPAPTDEAPPISPRIYAPFPKRRRNHSDASSNATLEQNFHDQGNPPQDYDFPSNLVNPLSPASTNHSTSNSVPQHPMNPQELRKAAEELLQRFDSVEITSQKISRGADKSSIKVVGSNGPRLGQVAVELTPPVSNDGNSNQGDDQPLALHKSDQQSVAIPIYNHSTEHNPPNSAGADQNKFWEDDRFSDDYAIRGGGKKRKVPASAQQGPPDEERDANGMHVGGGSGGGTKDGQGSVNVVACTHTCGHACDQAGEEVYDGQIDSGEQDDVPCTDPTHQHHHPSTQHRRKPTRSRRCLEFHKSLFDSRKQQVLSLHNDALNCLAQTKQKTSTIPTKEELEGLFDALEFAGMEGWEGDRVGNGLGMWSGRTARLKAAVYGDGEKDGGGGKKKPELPANIGEIIDIPDGARSRWRRFGKAAERYAWKHKEEVKRGGWIPEGSFEFEIRSPVSGILHRRTQELSTLRWHVKQLLTLTLSSPPIKKAATAPAPNPPAAPAANNANKPPVQSNAKVNPPATTAPTQPAPAQTSVKSPPPTTKPTPSKPAHPNNKTNKKPIANSENVTVAPSADVPDYVPPPPNAKKKNKKKKRSAAANAANPHHVKNYVPSRRPGSAPEEKPAPTLTDLFTTIFFPPPTRFLAARPQRPESNPAPPEPSDPPIEDYVCEFCEYDLFYGAMEAMEKAVERRKRILARREKAEQKAKGVMEGKGLNKKGNNNKYPPEPGCEGGDKCRCAELRAERKAKEKEGKTGVEESVEGDSEGDGEEYEEHEHEVQAQATGEPQDAQSDHTSLPPVDTFEAEEADGYDPAPEQVEEQTAAEEVYDDGMEFGPLTAFEAALLKSREDMDAPD